VGRYSGFARTAISDDSQDEKMADDEGDDDRQMRFPFMIDGKPRKSASLVTDDVKAIIFRMRHLGFIQSDIAAVVGTNQGRVSEVLRGLR
jgi:hypothetical protein